MTRSMTGFSRQDSTHDWGDLSVEIRAVNHRFLELSIRAPEELRSLDPGIRRVVGNFAKRGKVDVSVRFSAQASKRAELDLNEDIVAALESVNKRLGTRFRGTSMTPMEVLRWPGVVDEPEQDIESLQKATMDLIEKALKELVDSRRSEGERLHAMIVERLGEVTTLVGQVRQRLPVVREHIQAKLHSRLEALDVTADEGRLETEIALMLNKADVDEELDRLDSHVAEARSILDGSGAIGRKLDFLMQEFNREANTLSSKSQDTETTKLAVELKVLIEQMREQVQNIE